MHAPDAVQHCAAILEPSGVAVAVGEVMQTPSERASLEPLRAITRNGGGGGEGGGGDGGDWGAGDGSRMIWGDDGVGGDTGGGDGCVRIPKGGGDGDAGLILVDGGGGGEGDGEGDAAGG